MKSVFAVMMLALLLSGCATTGQPPVVPELGNRPRVPINTSQDQMNAAPAAAASINSPSSEGI